MGAALVTNATAAAVIIDLIQAIILSEIVLVNLEGWGFLGEVVRRDSASGLR